MPVWVDIDHDRVDHDRPGLAALGAAPAGGCGPGPDSDVEWLAEITVRVLLGIPATWADLVEFCTELQEMDAVLKAAGIPWLGDVRSYEEFVAVLEAVPGASQAASNGSGRGRGRGRVQGGPGAAERRRAAQFVLVSDVDCGVGRDSQGLTTTASTTLTIHVADSDSSVTYMAWCNGPLHEGAWLPLDEFTMIKRQGPGRKDRADGARKPRSHCKACHALIQRTRYGEHRKVYNDAWRAARKASARVVFKYSQDSSRGADSSHLHS